MFGSYRVNAEVVASASSLQLESPVNIAWHNCGKNVECAQVQVPLDWNSPAGPKISLSVARHLASKPNQRIGSLFVNYGGPGVAGVPHAQRLWGEAEGERHFVQVAIASRNFRMAREKRTR
jgi:hypothetical protein